MSRQQKWKTPRPSRLKRQLIGTFLGIIVVRILLVMLVVGVHATDDVVNVIEKISMTVEVPV